MKIKIITISKTKSEYQEAEQEFLKRLQRYADVAVLNLKEEPITKNRSNEDIKGVEGERIMSKIDEDAFVIVLDQKGNNMTSLEFANQIEQIRDFKGAKINFIIGGPLGLSGEILARGDLVLSLSEMTLTHQMIRLLLLEQIYRGFEILKGTDYHK